MSVSTSDNTPTPPSQQQQLAWGRDLAALIVEYPRATRAFIQGGITANPQQLVNHLNYNSASAEAFRSAFSTIDEYIAYIENEKAEMHDQIIRLESEAKAASKKDQNASHRRLTVDPDPFDAGEKDAEKRQIEYINWRSKVARVLQTDSHIFDTPFKRIQYTATRLSGKAYNLFQPRFDQVTDNKDDPSKWPWRDAQDEHAVVKTTALECLFEELNALYATMDLSKTASLNFDKLWMKGKTYPQFLAEFQTLASQCNKTDAQKVDELKRRISAELAAALQTQADVPAADAFDQWAHLLQKLWDRYQESQHFAKYRGGPVAPNAPHQQQQRQNAAFTPAVQQLPVPTSDPMQLDASRATLSKEECRQRSLCFYCKEAGHSIGFCVKKQAADERNRPGQQHQQQPPHPNNPLPGRQQQFGSQSTQYNQQYLQQYPQQHPQQYGHQRTHQQGRFNNPQQQPNRFRQLNLGGHVIGETDSASSAQDSNGGTDLAVGTDATNYQGKV